jgi:hypothetical protein
MTNNLLVEFAGDSVEQSELEQLLLMHFGNSVAISQNEIQYTYKGTNDAALILKYTKNGEISNIISGPGMRNSDIELLHNKIAQQLVKPNGYEVGQLVMFSHTPPAGEFRYRDLFQITPIPDNAPTLAYVIGDHPLLLQFQYPGSVDIQISMLRQTRIGRELELLMVALVLYIKGSIGRTIRHHWVIMGGENPATWESSYCQEGYIWPDAGGAKANFMEPSKYDKITRTVAAEHYNRRGISLGQKLDLPDILEQLLDIYFGMHRNDRDRFMRASYWFQYSQRVREISASGAFTALVSAVEALMPETKPESQCPTCNRPVGIGPTKQFSEFVETYAGQELTNGQRRDLYSLRSALSHGGSILHTDRFAWGGGMTSSLLSQWINEDTMRKIVRFVLVNWLLARREH